MLIFKQNCEVFDLLLPLMLMAMLFAGVVYMRRKRMAKE